MKDKKFLKIGDKFKFNYGDGEIEILTIKAMWSKIIPYRMMKNEDLSKVPSSSILITNVEYGGWNEYKRCIPLPKLFFKPIKKK